MANPAWISDPTRVATFSLAVKTLHLLIKMIKWNISQLNECCVKLNTKQAKIETTTVTMARQGDNKTKVELTPKLNRYIKTT